MLSDIEIASRAQMQTIDQIAGGIGILIGLIRRRRT